MKAYKVNHRISVSAILYDKRISHRPSYNYKAIDTKDLVTAHQRSDFSDLRDNIICAEKPNFYSQHAHIMRLDGCDIYPHASI